jgi:catechol 2,3-dioxygenase-like lactoylglutathione lyase family enzyme
VLSEIDALHYEDIMRRAVCVIALAMVVMGMPLRPAAQLLNTEAPVIVGHYHLNVTSIDEHRKFWVDTLGGTATKMGAIDVIRFPDVFLFLHAQKPAGPTYGTALDHIGFAVPDVPALTTKVVANGYQLTQGREPAPGQKVALPTAGNYGRFSYLLGPDGAKVELVTNMSPDPPPITHHHVHYINKQYVEMQQWYMRAFNATLRPGQTDFFIGADLPGVGYMLNFFRWEGDQSVTHAPTSGRVYDHVGYEVRGLQEFTRQLESKGIRLTRPYGKDPAMNGLATAAMVDPWGVSIELTEGLRDIR